MSETYDNGTSDWYEDHAIPRSKCPCLAVSDLWTDTQDVFLRWLGRLAPVSRLVMATSLNLLTMGRGRWNGSRVGAWRCERT